MSTAPRADHARWDDLPIDSPMPLLERRRLIGQHVMVSHISLRKGFSIASHTHANEQITVVLEGCIRFGVGEPGSEEFRHIVARSGETVLLPPDCPHGAEALENTIVLDIFSPPSAETGIDRADS